MISANKAYEIMPSRQAQIKRRLAELEEIEAAIIEAAKQDQTNVEVWVNSDDKYFIKDTLREYGFTCDINDHRFSLQDNTYKDLLRIWWLI